MTFGSNFGRTFSPTFNPKSQAVSGGWFPTDITGCKLWLDFSDADTLFTDAGKTKVANDGDAIYQANDKSGNNFNATQTTSANRPLYKTAKLNGLSTSYFDGSNDSFALPALGFSGNPPISVFVVQHTISNERNTYFTLGLGETNKCFAIRSDKDTKYYVYFYGNDASITGVSSYYGKYVLTNIIYTASSLTVSAYQNGIFIKNVTISSTPNVSNSNYKIGVNFGGYEPHYGYIAEIIIYNTALSDTDRGKVETYLNNKWAIYS